MPPRKGSRKIALKGLFPGAKVKRGPDWDWGDQDGTGTGSAVDFDNWEDSRMRNGLSIKWANGKQNSYRVGYRGKLDLIYVQASTWFQCYPTHLPVLGN